MSARNNALSNQHNVGLEHLEIRLNGYGIQSCDSYVEHAIHNGMLIVVEYDREPPNPRTEYDNFGHMYCAHSRYTLGDPEERESDLYSALSHSVTHNMEDEYIYDVRGREIRNRRYVDPDDMSAVFSAAEKAGFVILPLYLYDHSGLTISTGPFSCRWDSMLVGYTYATPSECAEFMPAGWQSMAPPQVQGKMRKAARAKATAALEAAVETYDAYLTGEVYGYTQYNFAVQYDAHADENYIEVGDEVDSCWGFYESPEDVIHDAVSSTHMSRLLPAIRPPHTLPIPMNA